MNGIKAESRRKTARAKVGSNEIAYLNFQSGNGAIVVDVSPEGLGFQAADPLQPNESLSFRLCTRDLPNIDLAGQVAWLDETRKRGGLHLSVPANSRLALQEWQRKYFDALPERKPEPPAKTSPPAASSVEAPPKSSEFPNSSEPDARPGSPVANFEPRPPAASSVPRPVAPNLMGRGPLFVSEWEYPPEESHTGRNVLVVCVILALGLVLAGSYFLGGRRQFGALLIHLGQSLTGSSQAPLRALAAKNANALPPAQPKLPSQSSSLTSSNSAAQTSPEATPPAAAAPSAPATPSSGANENRASSLAPSATPASIPTANPPTSAPQTQPTNAASAPTASQPQSASSAADAPPKNSSASRSHAETKASAAASPGNGQAEVAQARQLLRDSNPQDSSVAASLLWSAVGKGNTRAELTLANLYLEGHGAIRKNCEQAEVLLSAARSANVPGAAAKLQDLQTYGCR